MAERLTVISGPMFAGKSEELMRLLGRKKIARHPYVVVKPAIDNRWNTTMVRSHAGRELAAVPVEKPSEILHLIRPDTSAVAIDEVQFFSPEIVDVIEELLGRTIEVICAGLPSDFRDEPFGPMGTLLAKADAVTHLSALCTFILDDGSMCIENATKTQRLVNGEPAHYNDPIVLVGAEESYAARCRTHHIVPGKPEPQL